MASSNAFSKQDESVKRFPLNQEKNSGEKAAVLLGTIFAKFSFRN